MSISERLSQAGISSRLKALSLYGEAALLSLRTHPEDHIQELTSLKKGIEEFFGKPPSRPRLSAGYTIQYTELIRKRIHIDNPYLFGASSAQSLTSWFDMEHGVRETVSRILVAERAIAEGPDAPIADIIKNKNSSRNPVSAVDDAEHYLRLQKKVLEAVALLQKDPTGFLLIDTFVGQLKEDSDQQKKEDFIKTGRIIFISPDRTPELVIAGAELAQRIYKEIYPLSGRLPA